MQNYVPCFICSDSFSDIYTQGTQLNTSHSSSEMSLCVIVPTERSSTVVISGTGNIKGSN